MNKLQFEARLSSLRSLSTLPAVMAEVLRICEDPETPISDLAEIIRRDPALSTKVLKIVNSPYYGQSQQVASIQSAVLTLGSAQVKALALSLSLYSLSAQLGEKVDLKDFWRHSLNVACVSELIAKRVAPQLCEEAFVAGCIHDIGMLVLDKFYPNEYFKVIEAAIAGNELTRMEQEHFECDHAEAGELILRIWNFPERYCAAVARHHEVLELNEEKQADILPTIVNLADKLATFTIENTASSRTVNLSNREVMASNLGLNSDDLKEIEYAALSEMMERSQHLEIDVGNPSELLQRATHQLYNLYSFTEGLYHDLVETKAQLDEEKLNKVALESLQAIVATFSHYLNNAIASVSGRTQLLEMALNSGRIEDGEGLLRKSLEVYDRNVEQISSVIEKLKSVKIFKTAIYHENTKIIDFEKEARISRKQLEQRLTEGLPHPVLETENPAG